MTLLRRSFPTVVAVVLVCVSLSSPALSQFDEMVKHVPSHANALFLVNAEKVFASEVAKSQHWQAQRGKRFDSGLTCLPAKATRVVIGSQIDLEVMRPMWEAAIVEFPQAPTLADVSQHFGGIDDMIANTSVLHVADDSCVVRLSDHLLGAFGPGNRQLVSSWLEQTDAQLSPYLREALGYEDAGAEIILAIDAANALTPALIEQRLAASTDTAVSNAKLSTQDIAQIVSSLKGVMLGITFGQQPYGKIKIDFGQDATPLSDIAKPLVLAALANHGAVIDEMNEWKVEVKGSTIYLDGHLGESGLTRIASLVNLPTHAMHSPATSNVPAAAAKTPPAQSPSDPGQVVLEATQQYYQSIGHLLADLKGRKGEERTIGQIGVWFQSYANKVDRLPILNIDDEMLQYGQYVAQQLRNASMAIKGYGINKRVAEVNATDSVGPYGPSGGYAGAYYGPYGRPVGAYAAYGWANRAASGAGLYYAGRAQMREATAARTQVDVQLKAGAATSVQGIMEGLREAHEKIRVDMTKKYKVEF